MPKNTFTFIFEKSVAEGALGFLHKCERNIAFQVVVELLHFIASTNILSLLSKTKIKKKEDDTTIDRTASIFCEQMC